MRRCACPREEPMTWMPSSVKYRHGDRCRKRAYRAKVKRAATAVGLQVAPSLKAVEAMRPSGARDGHAETAGKPRERRRETPRVNYRKAVDALHSLLFEADPSTWAFLEPADIENALAECLTPKQREALNQQETRMTVEEKLARAELALAFYESPDNWAPVAPETVSAVARDQGSFARDCLKEIGSTEDA